MLPYINGVFGKAAIQSHSLPLWCCCKRQVLSSSSQRDLILSAVLETHLLRYLKCLTANLAKLDERF